MENYKRVIKHLKKEELSTQKVELGNITALKGALSILKNIEIQSKLESQIKNYKLITFNDSLMIFQLENQLKLKNDLIKEVTPKWYENKYLWFGYGVCTILIPTFVFGR